MTTNNKFCHSTEGIFEDYEDFRIPQEFRSYITQTGDSYTKAKYTYKYYVKSPGDYSPSSVLVNEILTKDIIESFSFMISYRDKLNKRRELKVNKEFKQDIFTDEYVLPSDSPSLQRIEYLGNQISSKDSISDFSDFLLTVSHDYRIGQIEVEINFRDNLLNINELKTQAEKFHACIKNKLADKKEDIPANEQAIVHMIVLNPRGYDLQKISFRTKPLEEKNYDSGIVKQYRDMKEQLSAEEPFGRLHVINGPPGTGKTFMLRDIITNWNNCNYVLIKANQLQALTDPHIVSTLLERYGEGNKNLVFIIEDGDDLISNRNVENQSKISSVLNMADGIIGTILDIRFIITANISDDSIDDAVKRPGRLGQHLFIDGLKFDQAWQRAAELTSEKYVKFHWADKNPNEKITLAEIYNLVNKYRLDNK